MGLEGQHWAQVSRRPLSRRRVIAASGAAVLGTGILAACGPDEGRSRSPQRGLLTRPQDTTKQAKPNGTLRDRAFAEPSSLDIVSALAPLNTVAPMAYSTLVQFKPGYLKPSELDLTGDLAESWEWSPDGLQIAMKLRPGLRWHEKAPVNGRAVDMEDVLFSWNRFAAKSSGRSALVQAVNPGAPVLSLTATDAQTIVLKLKEPLVYTPALFANNRSGGMTILPKETDTTFNIRNDMIGTGPFVQTSYRPSLGFTLKRNPAYYDKDYALIGQVELPILSEYAATLAQFKAGNIYHFGSQSRAALISQEDILPIKREQPLINIYQDELGAPAEFSRLLAFGWLPEGKSPFIDQRVRQAVSMAIDRDLWLDVVFNASRFEAEGLPVTKRWNTALGGALEGWWLDPTGRDFGPNAKYLSHDLAEATKLLAAAGYASGFDTLSSYVTGPEFPVAKHAEMMDGFISNVGIRSTVSPLDYTNEYIPRFRDGKGRYQGWAHVGGAVGDDPVGILASQYWSRSGVSSFLGFSTSGRNDVSGDPKVDGLIEAARVERDTSKRKELIYDLQRHLAGAMYAVPAPGVGTALTVAWPCVANFRVFSGARLNYGVWIDESKPPFKAS